VLRQVDQYFIRNFDNFNSSKNNPEGKGFFYGQLLRILKDVVQRSFLM
jgi:hypothetical protein